MGSIEEEYAFLVAIALRRKDGCFNEVKNKLGNDIKSSFESIINSYLYKDKPLIYHACINGHLEGIQFLLEHGANKFYVTHLNKYP